MSKSNLLESGIEKLSKLNHRLTDYFVEREDVIHTSILALISRQHHLQIGPPGTAKSAIATAICKAINGARIFDVLMTRSMDPSELLGPYSLKSMEDDDFKRVTNGFAPEGDILFLDELYRANDPILNSLLWILNERKIRNGKEVSTVPLICMFSGTNALYEGSSLDALHSRITFRLPVSFVTEKDNFVAMIENSLSNGAGPHVEDIGLTIKELEAVQAQVDSVKVPKAIYADALWAIRSELKQHEVYLDDRKAVWLMKTVVRSEAIFQGRDTVEVEDLNILTHCLWDTEAQITPIRHTINRIASPVMDEAQRYIESAGKATSGAFAKKRDMNNADSPEVQAAFLDANKELKGILAKLQDRINETSGKSQTYLKGAQRKAQNYHKRILEGMGVSL